MSGAPGGPLGRIHHINPQFNLRFDRPLYYAGAAVTALAFVSPYSLRILLALLLNIFFNRPTVYAQLFAEKIGRRLGLLLLDACYVSIVGVYALAYRLWKRFCGASRGVLQWAPLEDHPAQRYFRQS